MRTRAVFLGSVCAAAVAASGWAAFAQADDGPSHLAPSPSSSESIKPGPEPEGLTDQSTTDDALPVVADHILSLGDGHGLAGQTTDYANRAITVYWAGSVPAEIRRYAESKPLGVSVSLVEGARYSGVEGNAARARLQNHAISREIGMVTASVPGDGSGLEIGVTRTEPLTEAEMAELRSIAGIENIEVRYGVAESATY